ncbi:MAG TPA: hypothetical protein DDW52_24230, partial [Planctomycetaceae bacterium]|nr:hypothetical protein [Planctomycetaceae bacterium]
MTTPNDRSDELPDDLSRNEPRAAEGTGPADPLEVEVQKALADYMNKCDSGEVLDRKEFIRQHPELGGELADLLSVADWIEDLAGPRVADLAKS